MTQYTTLTLVPTLQYGTANGSYAGGNVYVSNAFPAANYYGGQGAIQTLLFNVNAFQGNISIRATLNDLAESAPYFEIANVIASANVSGNAITQVTSNTVVGNFTWLQATVTDFSAGNVTVFASY
jgi:hypothetical protein